MKRIILFITLLTFVGSISLQAQRRKSAQSPKFAKLEIAMYPQAPEGYKQVYFQVPIKNNENNFKVELIVGKYEMLDCNKHFLTGEIQEKVVDGWGYTYYSVQTDGKIISTLMACLEDAKTKKFVSMDPLMLRYNSKLPIVVYVPEGYEVKYRVWSAPGVYRDVAGRSVLPSKEIKAPAKSDSSANIVTAVPTKPTPATVASKTPVQNEASANQIQDRKWRLVELNGKPVDSTPENAYVIFHSNGNRMEAKAKCNMLRYGYSVFDGFRLKFDPNGVSTRMACPDKLEDEFIKMLSQVDNFTTNGYNLSLNKGRMAPLARFVLVQ